MVARTAAAALLTLSFGAWAGLPDYDLINLVPLPTGSGANDVSPNGTVVGSYGATSTAFVWKNGTRRDLGPGRAQAVNDSGLIGGQDASGHIQFWMPDGTVVTTDRYGGVTRINASGVANGGYSDAPFTAATHAFLWQNGQFTEIPAGCWGGINNAGQVLCNGPALYDVATGQMTSIPLPSAGGFNDKGEVVGSTRTGGFFLYSGGVVTHVVSVSDAGADGLNNNDLMIGDEEGLYGFVADTSGNIKFFGGFNSVKSQGFNHLHGNAINDNGWIVGIASTGPQSPSQSFLLIPRTASSSGTPPPLAMSVAKRTDFNGDFRGDLLWHSSGGGYGVWLMDGHNIVQSAAITAPAGASFVLRGDFNGDGRTDLLWKDSAGAYYISLVNGTALDTTQVINAGTGWVVAGAGDFSGDGKTDLLWWHPTQGYGAWLMNGAAVTQYGLVTQVPNARPAIIADFNGDGRDDIAWLGDDGHVELYTMNGLTATAAGQVRAAGTGFVPSAVGDFNGDGKADIVWANPDGRQSLWLMDGASTLNSTSLVDAGSPWSVLSAPDFDGDGRADLLWKAMDGSYGAWLMSGTTTVAYQLLIGGGSGWSVVQSIDTSSDNKADLIWRRADGEYGLWLMNGLGATWQGVVLGPGSGWEVVP